ncbi:MAG: hypothetical protein V4463_03370 [Pseudomonadota bacterium]
MDPAIIKLEVRADAHEKALEVLTVRVEKGFTDLRAEQAGMRSELNAHMRWIIRIQLTTILAMFAFVARGIGLV